MKNLENDIDFIEKYLEGSLSENENIAFQQRLAKDAEFDDIYHKRKLLQESFIEATVRVNIKKAIRSAIAEEKRRSKTRQRIWLAAATLIILATFGSLLIYNSFNNMPENQFATEQNPSEKGDREATQRKSNNMEEYGNLDKVVRKESVDGFSPDEFTTLKANDTIIFNWPSSPNERYFAIYNDNGGLIKEETIEENSIGFKLLPGILKPGTYYWKFKNDDALIRIIVSK